ncbi:hypothetical protein PV325_008919 [Microctonus aethiopoides]|uniref:Uncharacterized protein n=1 Tax=Microctonus aethiopoides TaxID=144406 RepID=A0AA39F9U2_9HYME|nr:hypothetical protein PV325_008919 [Microctonus aethiopoides]KAK0076489.1 hypothetical protein PV326_010732 [Microctonus aethiopoides]KAK0165614.1 hypothetical protein PV328_004116 [Microctonus aethiopoides]
MNKKNKNSDFQSNKKKLKMMRVLFNELRNFDFKNFMQNAILATIGPSSTPPSLPQASPPPSLSQASPPPSIPLALPPP